MDTTEAWIRSTFLRKGDHPGCRFVDVPRGEDLAVGGERNGCTLCAFHSAFSAGLDDTVVAEARVRAAVGKEARQDQFGEADQFCRCVFAFPGKDDPAVGLGCDPGGSEGQLGATAFAKGRVEVAVRLQLTDRSRSTPALRLVHGCAEG